MENHQVTLDRIATALGHLENDIRKEFFIQAIRFLDGDLSERDMLGFEQRISEDPGLARQFESLALLDAAQRAAFTDNAGRTSANTKPESTRVSTLG